EAVHFNEQLVERLFALVVAATDSLAAALADRVDLVDEDDRGRVSLRLFEEVAHPARSDTDKHFDKVGAGDGVEGHAGLACYRAGEKRFTGSGRAVEQHALRDAGPNRLEAGGVLQEVFDLVQ